MLCTMHRSSKNPSNPAPSPAPSAVRAPVRGVQARAVASLACALMAFFVTNDGVYVELGQTVPFSREVATGFSVAVMAVIAACARWRPRLLSYRAWTAASLVSTVLYGVCCAVGLTAGKPLLLAVGALFESFAEAWLYVLAYSTLASLDTERRSPVLAATFLFAYAFATVINMASSGWLFLVNVAFFVTIFACAGPIARDVVADIASGEPAADLAATNPLSFMPANHLFFLIALMFSFAQGIALALASADAVPVAYLPAAVVMAMLLAGCVASKRRLDPDVLFMVAALMALAGMIVAPAASLFDGTAVAASHGLLNGGAASFNLLLTLTIVRVTSHNRASTVFFASYAVLLNWLGVGLGAMAGHSFADAYAWRPEAVYGLSVLVAIAFAACSMLVTKYFDFKQAIEAIEPVQEVQPAASASPTFDEHCEEVARSFGLTPRETEVFTLLAHGRTLRVISEQLVISPNTVRFHTKNVYSKLGIHSQQELIDLAER